MPPLFRLFKIIEELAVKNLEYWLSRQRVYALIPLSDMGCRCGYFLASNGMPISLANIK